MFYLRIYTIDAPIAFNRPVIFDDVDQSAYGIQVLHAAIPPRRIGPVENIQSIRIGAISSGIRQRIWKRHETRRNRVKTARRLRVIRFCLVESLVRIRKMLLTLGESATSKMQNIFIDRSCRIKFPFVKFANTCKI